MPSARPATHPGILIFSAIVLVIIVVTFVGAPVVSKVSETPSYVFGSYAGEPVEFQQGNYFAQEVEQINRFYEQYSKGNVESLRHIVWQQAFEQSAIQVALKHDATKAGIVVTEDAINKALVNNPAYQRDGQFSDEAYRNASKAEQYKYAQETKTELLIGAYTSDRLSAPMVSDSLKQFMGTMAYPQKKFSFIVFNDTDYPDSLVNTYGITNKKLFQTIALDRITITSGEGDAKKIRETALKGEKSFEDLAKTYSKEDATAEAGGALNTKYYYELKEEFEKASDLDKVFALKKGDVSPIFTKGKTWVFYKVVTPVADADFTNPAQLAAVRTYINRNDMGILEDYLEAQAKTFKQTVTSANFEAQAKKINKTVEKTDFVGVNFGNSNLFTPLSTATQNSAFQDLAANPSFFKQVAKLPKDGISDPVLANPAVFVLKVDEVKDAPAATDAPWDASKVDNMLRQERSSALREGILESPQFKNDFDKTFDKLYKRQ